MSAADYVLWLAKHTHPNPDAASVGCANEAQLHEQIIDYCNSQWPRWKFIHARMDKPSTIAVSAHDFTIFMPGGRTLCVECKRKGAKLTPEQLGWLLEMGRLGHDVHVIYSFDDFNVAMGQKTVKNAKS